MGKNLGNSLKKFLSNKNTVTFLGVIIGIVVLFFGYQYRVNSAISPVTIPIAKVTIKAKEKITEDKLTTVQLPKSEVAKLEAEQALTEKLEKATENFKYFRVERWINNPSLELDVPIITPSNIMSGLGAGSNNYGKAALGYLAIRDYLGEEMFLKALHGYMDRWNGKHPIPWDFFYSFNDIAGEDLNWFWNSWFFSNNYIDLSINKVKVGGKKATIQVDNIGGMPAPFDIVVKMKNGEIKVFHQTPEVWKNNLSTTTIKLKDVKEIVEIQIKGGIWMDANRKNNIWKK